MNVVIGVDPGRSCGLSVFYDTQLAFIWQGPRERVRTVVVNQLEHASHVLRQSPHAGDGRVCIAVERYVQLRGHHGRTPQNDALEVIGVVSAAASVSNVEVTMQSPADARALAPDEVLRQLGVYATGGDVNCPDADDANMATRHALLHMAVKHNTLFSQLVSRAGRG